MTVQSAISPGGAVGGSRTRAVAAATIGSALEWYDFIVYSFFAAMIGKLFFPAALPNTQLLIGLATFGVGFFMRPLGAIVLGIYGDRKGRRAALTLTIAIMIIGIAILTFVPTYQSIGFLAPILVVLARLFQGFSAGGEFGGTTSYLSEYSLQHRRGLYVSWQMSSQFMASLLGGVVAALLTANLSADALASYGWRIPFAIGLLIGPVGFYIRRRLEDTPAFTAQTKSEVWRLPDSTRNHLALVQWGLGMILLGSFTAYLVTLILPAESQTYLLPPNVFAGVALASLFGMIWCLVARGLAQTEVGEVLRGHGKIVLCGFGMVVLGTVCVYVLVLFLPGYASRQFHLPQSAAFAITAYMSLVAAIWCVIAGWLSDRVGRKPLLLISSIGLVILTYPLFAFLAAAPSLTRLVIIETVFALLVSTFASVSPTLLAELFPTRVRNTSLALSYNIAVAIFGGFGQFIVAWLIIKTGDVLAPAYYVTAASVIGLLGVLPLADRGGGKALE